jgi:serine/threonine protein kinase
MEYAPGGELFELLKLYPKMKENQARFYVVETLLGLKYLHNQNIIYRDVKPENLMLD